MDVSVLVYKNHQSANVKRYDFQLLVYLFYHHNPENFLENYWPTIFIKKIFFMIVISSVWFCSASKPMTKIWLISENTSVYSVQFGYSKRRLIRFNVNLQTQSREKVRDSLYDYSFISALSLPVTCWIQFCLHQGPALLVEASN